MDELVIVDPEQRSVQLLSLQAGEHSPTPSNRLTELAAAELAQRIDWPWRADQCWRCGRA